MSGPATDSQHWTVDGVGNWTQMTRQGTPTDTLVSVHNAYTQWGGTARSYDSNGNLLDDGLYLYQYDYLNRLRVVKWKATQVTLATYSYDAMNRRIFRSTTGETLRYLYDSWYAVEERDSGGTVVVKQFVYGESLDEILRMDSYAGGVIQASYYGSAPLN